MPCFEDYDLIKTIQICSFGSSQQADRVFLNAETFIYMRENHRVLNITLKGKKKKSSSKPFSDYIPGNSI